MQQTLLSAMSPPAAKHNSGRLHINKTSAFWGGELSNTLSTAQLTLQIYEAASQNDTREEKLLREESA